MKRVIRTIQYVGPDEQVDFLLARVVGPAGFTAGHVRITELDVNEQNNDGEILRAFVRDERYGSHLKENTDKTLTPAEVEVIAHALTSQDARSDAIDATLDSIRAKLGIENPYAKPECAFSEEFYREYVKSMATIVEVARRIGRDYGWVGAQLKLAKKLYDKGE